MFKNKVSILLLGLSIVACVGSQTYAGMTTEQYTFNVSNTYANVTNYGTVTITAYDSGPDAGKVVFEVYANENPDGLYGSLSNFGIQTFGFNVTDNSILDASSMSWTLPSGWDFKIQPSNSLSMFGVFEATTGGTGGTRQNPLTFTLMFDDASLAVASNFVSTSSNGFLFAAHVAGYESSPGSHWIGVVDDPGPGPGTGGVPAPGSLALGVIGLVSLGYKRRSLA